MNKAVLLSALLSFAIAAPAVAKDAKTSFTLDDVTYTYTVKNVGDSTVIQGRASPGEPFYYVVRGKDVTGETNGIRVSFRVPESPEKVAAGISLSTR